MTLCQPHPLLILGHLANLLHMNAPLRRARNQLGGPIREPLSYALSTRAKVSCLRVLSIASSGLTQREVARRAGVQHRSSQLALDDLVALGLVRRLQGGRDFNVSLNDDHRLSAVIRELFRSESEFFLALRSELAAAATDAPRPVRPSSLILFGSVARGDDQLGSDLDLLLLAWTAAGIEPALVRIGQAAGRLRDRYGCELRPIAYTVAEARRRWRRREAPFPDIVRDHIVLVGPPLREVIDGKNRPRKAN